MSSTSVKVTAIVVAAIGGATVGFYLQVTHSHALDHNDHSAFLPFTLPRSLL